MEDSWGIFPSGSKKRGRYSPSSLQDKEMLRNTAFSGIFSSSRSPFHVRIFAYLLTTSGRSNVVRKVRPVDGEVSNPRGVWSVPS